MEVFRGTRRERIEKLALSACILLIGLASITSRSLWSDEILHAQWIASRDLPATIRSGLVYGKVGYMFIEYLWSCLIGGQTGEFALRLSNLLFTVPAILFVFRIVRRRGWPLWMSLLFFVHPMYVYYMNEVTPYILLYALSLDFVDRVLLTDGDEFSSTGNIVAINAIFLLGVFVHFIFGFAIIMYFVRCFRTIRRDRKLVRRHAAVMLGFGVGYLPLLFLVLTRMRGTALGFRFYNPLYVIYSFLGMGGLGLPRDQLRQMQFSAITPVEIALLGLFTLTALAVFALNWRKNKHALARDRELLIPLLAYFAVLMLVAIPAHFAMWERHCMPMLPVYIIFFGDCMLEVIRERGAKPLYALFLILLLVSSARLKLSDVYGRDDFRGVTEYVAQALQEDDELTVIMCRKNRYYDLSEAIVSPKQEVIGILGMPSLDTYTDFMERVGRKEHVMMVMYASDIPRVGYNYFDTQPGFEVVSDYRSFKVVRPVY